MESEILQDRLRFAPWTNAQASRLPGVMPLDMAAWLNVDEAYSRQIAEKARLLAGCADKVHMIAPGAVAAAEELLTFTLDQLRQRDGFDVGADSVACPDGREVTLDYAAPLITLSQLVQEDLVIMQKPSGAEHILTAALLCFPASWTLGEKFLKPLTDIHVPVGSYDANIAKRVQRLFDAIQPDRPLWRANALLYQDAALFQPRREAAPRIRTGRLTPYIRSERQCLLRLPETGAVVFSIHTTVIRRENLTEAQALDGVHLDTVLG